jgi:hypothetical protein
MRVPERHPRTRRATCATLALAALLAATGAATPPPLAAFERFELAAVVLADDLPAGDASEAARRQLQMQLADRLDPWIAERNRKPARGTPPRTLRIEPVVVAVDPVDPATRAAVGAMAGSGQLRVHVRFVDAATGELAAETELQAGNPMRVDVAITEAAGAPPRSIAEALVAFLDAAMTSAPTPEPRLPR